MSVLSFPDRGPWGKSCWPGNCSGHVFREIFAYTKPRLFVDAMAGSFTSVEAARDMGIEAIGLDLHMGFNILRDSILERVGRPACLVLTHAPYGGMIKYSGRGAVWGEEPHPDDLSHCRDDADFHQKLHVALLNQREATRTGGYYGTIIGDHRRDGMYTSYQAEILTRMPAAELAGVLVKIQHNTASSRRRYPTMALPLIAHEYILLWKKRACTLYHLLGTLAKAQAQRLQGTWRAVVRAVMIQLGGKAELAAVYAAVAAGAPDHVAKNTNWQAKVRQVLNSSGEYTSCARGVWAIA